MQLPLIGALALVLFPLVASAAPSWPSGMTSVNRERAEAWRGSRFQVVTAYLGMNSWPSIISSAEHLSRFKAPIVAVGMPMLPKDHPGKLRECAAGQYDRHMRAFKAHVPPGQIYYLRLGWEANRIKGYPWGASDPAAWVSCWKRWVTNLGRKQFRYVWNMGNLGSARYPIDRLYPGNAWVDVIASQYFDRCPAAKDEATFRRVMSARDIWGNPAGPGSWLAYARKKGKPYAVPEWGIGGTVKVCGNHGFDNAWLVRRWYAWLSENRRDIAFEAYFNGRDGSGPGDHQIFPVKDWPKASAAYRELW